VLWVLDDRREERDRALTAVHEVFREARLPTWFQWTSDALKALRAEGTPGEILSRLEKLGDQRFATTAGALDELRKLLSDDQLERHQARILARGLTFEPHHVIGWSGDAGDMPAPGHGPPADIVIMDLNLDLAGDEPGGLQCV